MSNTKTKSNGNNREQAITTLEQETRLKTSKISAVTEDQLLLPQEVLAKHSSIEQKIKDNAIVVLLNKLPVINWQDTKIQRDELISDDCLVCLNGTYTTDKTRKHPVLGILKYNYGVGDILLTSDNENYIKIGSIGSLPSTIEDMHAFTPTDAHIDRQLSSAKYKNNIYAIAKNKAIALFDQKTNFLKAAKRVEDNRLKHSVQSNNSKLLSTVVYSSDS